MLLGGLGGIMANRYFFPYLSTTGIFSKYDFLKKSADDVTIINKTEQVFIKEETSINKISDGVTSSIVSIVSFPDKDAAGVAKKAVNSAVVKNAVGVVATSDGIIMTYAPAINLENSKYTVLLRNGSSYDGELIGVDSYSDLAFLKINGSNLSAISFGDVDNTNSGEKIIAIGNNSDASENSYAAGLLSKFDREYNLAGKTLSSSEKLEGVFKSDFRLERFFSGGPVVDYAGRVIGIAGFMNKDNYDDFFIIPSKKIKAVIEKVVNKKIDKNPILGIYYIPLSKTNALIYGVSAEKGALIFSLSGQQGLAILAGSSAQKAGLRMGDIISAINNEEINSNKPLSDLLYQYSQGDEIELTVLRNDQEMKIKALL